jgi:hypothetical protein
MELIEISHGFPHFVQAYAQGNTLNTATAYSPILYN